MSEKVQGRKLGLRIIEALTGISESVGCYKTILNCSDKNIREFVLFFFFSVGCVMGCTESIDSFLRKMRL